MPLFGGKKSATPAKPTAIDAWIQEHLSTVPFVQKILFVHNLSIMVKAGLSIVDGLRILSEQVENKKLQSVLKEIKAQVEKGRQLSEVLNDFPKVFPPIYVSMIAAGEAAGKMEDSLVQVSNQMKKSQELTSRIRGALIYPAVVLTAMGGIGVGMVVFVLPKILSMFTDFHAELPLATQVLIAVVNATQNYGLLMLIAGVGLVTLAIWLNRKPQIKHVMHGVYLKLPVVGKVMQKINISRFTLTLSSLLQSAIPIIDAIRITASVVNNVRYREDLLAVADALKKGEPLSECLNRSPERFPPMVTQMIMVGEQAGEVEGMLKELAEYYSNEVDETMRNFSTIIEPVLILILGVGVAGIAVAVIMPIYSLTQSM